MLDHFPSEPGVPTETSHGRSNGRVPGSVRLGILLRREITGAGQDFTGLAAAVQLRLRVAIGLQALQRCSGLLNRRARGSTVATHHFADVAQQRQQQFRKLPGIAPRECESLRRPHFAPVAQTIRAGRFEPRLQVRFLPGVPFLPR